MRQLRTVLLAVVALALLSCRGRDRPEVGQLTADGRVEVAASGGPFGAVNSTTRALRPGDRVQVLEGSAILALGEGASIELRAGSTAALLNPLGRVPTAELIDGDALVVAPTSVRVVVAGTTLTVQGAARATRGLAVAAATYQGTTRVESAGKSLDVPALRQVTIAAAGLVPARPSPLTFSPADVWDQRFLGDAIELSSQLVNRSRGVTNQLGAAGGTPALYRSLLPSLEAEPSFGTALLATGRPAGETVIGAAIALAASDGSFDARWQAVFSFHDEGAAWGLVVLDQGVSRSAVIEGVDAAIAVLQGRRAATPPQPPARTQAPTPTPSPTASTPSPEPAPTGSSPSGSSPSGSSPSGSSPSGSSPSGSSPPAATTTTTVPSQPLERTTGVRLGVPLLDGTVNSLVDALGGLLRGLSTPL